MKKHFRSDGNGGWYMSKAALGTVVALLTVLGAIYVAAANFTTAQVDIQHLEKQHDTLNPQVVENSKDIAYVSATLEEVNERTIRIEHRLNDLIKR